MNDTARLDMIARLRSIVDLAADLARELERPIEVTKMNEAVALAIKSDIDAVLDLLNRSAH